MNFLDFLVFGNHQIEKAQQASLIEEVVTSNEKIDGTLIDVSLMKDLQFTETFIDTFAVCKFNTIKINQFKNLISRRYSRP